MGHHIFFSYSHDNAKEAEIVVNSLRAGGFVVWQDTSDIRATDEWNAKISSGIAESAVFVVLWSAAAADPNRWVIKEIAIAVGQHKPMTALMLDSTPLSSTIKDNQAIQAAGNLNNAVMKLMEDLALRFPEIRRRKKGFATGTRLSEQSVSKTLPLDENTTLAWVPLFESGYCNAHVVGPLDSMIKFPTTIQLCLQFFKGPNFNFIPDVYHWVKTTQQQSKQEGVTQKPDLSLAMIHITSPLNAIKDEYSLDNDNSAVWLDAIDTTYAAVQLFSEAKKPILQVFNLAPASVMLGIGLRFYRFWHLQSYNLVGGTYKRVYEVFPDGT